jgi:hypothetical protein
VEKAYNQMKLFAIFSLTCMVIYSPSNLFAQSIRSDSAGLKGIARDSTDSHPNVKVDLKEVEITSRQMIEKDGKTIFFPTKAVKEHSSDGYKLLYNLMLPQLKIDPLEKTVKSARGDVLICINGRKALQDEIQTLQPKDVLRVDYYNKRNNPEHPEATEVLDFITIQRDYGGMVSAQGTQHLNKAAGDYNAMAHYYKKDSEYAFGFLNNYRNYSDTYKDVTETFKFPKQTIVRTETGEPASRKNSELAGYGNYSYHNEKTKIDLTLEYINKEEPHLDTKAAYNYHLDSISNSIAKGHTESTNHALYIETNLSQQLNKDQLITLNLTTTYSKNLYNRLYQETATDNDVTQTIESNVNEKYIDISGQLSYIKTLLDKSQISVIEINDQSKTNDSYRNNINRDEELKSGSTMIFLSYSKKWEKLSLDAKLGVSGTYFNLFDSISKSYFAILPTISLEYQLNDHSSIALSEYLYNNTPSLEWQSTIQQNIDFMQINRGNPSVKQMNILENYLTYSLSLPNVSFSANIWNLNNFRNASYNVFNENNIFVHTYVTEGQFHVLSPTISSKIELIKNLFSAKIEGSWAKYWITGVNDITLAQWAFSSELLFSHKNWMITLGYESPEKRLVNSGRTIQTNALYDFNINYTYHNLNISMGARNPFSKSNICYKFTTNDYSSDETKIQNRMGDHIFFTTLSYNFQFGKKYDFQDKNINTNTNSAIMKSEL